MPKIYVSRQRYKELENELKNLKGKGRHEIADRLREAKELGDISENSEYQEARNEQIALETRINQLENTLRNASIIGKTKSKGTVEIGSQVKVQRGRTIFAYTIVGSDEADPSKGLISNESPLGTNLLGKRVGDHIDIETPKGKTEYQVIRVE